MENVPQPPILLFRNNQVFEACTSMGVTDMGTWRNIIISERFNPTLAPPLPLCHEQACSFSAVDVPDLHIQ